MECNVLEEKKVYTGIDIGKLIAAVLIVLLHAIENTNWYSCEVKFVLTRCAVPFFFITSGFFFCEGLKKSVDKKLYFKQYERKLIIIYTLWALIIYLPFEVKTYITKYAGDSVFKIVAIMLRKLFIVGPGPYWYLMAMMLAAAIIYWCSSKKESYLICALVVGVLLEIMYSSFRGICSRIIIFELLFKLIDFVYSWEFNFIMYGIPFMGMGYLLAKYNWTVKKRIAILVWVVSTVIRVIEYNLPIIFNNCDFVRNNNISVAFIMQALAFFMIAKEVDIKMDNKKSVTLRQFSSFIYFSHAIILYEIMNPVLKKITDWPIYDNSFILPKVIVTLAICTLLFCIIKRINNPKLNILING